MWSSIGTVGAVAVLAMTCGRALIMWIALRGTKPSERPAIIRALNDAKPRAAPRARAVGRLRA
jgi:hypothetical protein